MAVRDEDGVRVSGELAAQPVFSVTKMFVAVAVLRLAESGTLSLDAEVAGVSVRELLGHTGGLPDYATDARYLEAAAARDTPWGADRIAAVAGRHSERGRFRYSNLGYWLLGEFVESITGVSLGNTLAELVFEPAGMGDTVYPEVGAGLTPGGYDTRWAGPAGAVWSTPADVVEFLSHLLGGSLLSPDSLTAMTTTTPVAAGAPWRAPGYGLGLMIDREYGVLGHAGGGPEYTSAAFIAPEKHRCVAVIAGPQTEEDPIATALKTLH